MIERVNLVFNCNCLGRWSLLDGTKVYRVSSEIWQDNGGSTSVRKGASVRQWSGRPEFNLRSRHTKDFKNGTWYLLTLSNIRYVSRVKWTSPGKGVASSPTPRCSSYWKGSFLVALDYGHQLFLFMKRRGSFLEKKKEERRNEVGGGQGFMHILFHPVYIFSLIR